MVHKQQTAFHLVFSPVKLWSESPGIQRPNWIFSALPLHASNIFYSWCKSDGEDCNCRLTGVCSWSTGSIALVKAIRKQHSKPQNVGNRQKCIFPSKTELYQFCLGEAGPQNPPLKEENLIFIPEQLIGRVWSDVKILLLSVNFVFRTCMVLNGSPENQFSEYIL